VHLCAILQLPVASTERLACPRSTEPLANETRGGSSTAALQCWRSSTAIDVDRGTAAEVGYAAAKRNPVVGLRCDHRVTGDNEATS
jgi:hypothetical protein